MMDLGKFGGWTHCSGQRETASAKAQKQEPA